MPGLVRKLLIIAAVDGLVLQPVAHRSQRPAAPITIDYKTHAIKPLLRSHHRDDAQNDSFLEVYGVIGVLRVASAAYLVAISRRKQVAQIYGKPIYCITGVVVVPISSQRDAQEVIERAQDESHDGLVGDLGADVVAQESDSVSISDNDASSTRASTEVKRPSLDHYGRQFSGDRRDPGIAEEVISKKGLYGRFTERWFSKRGWNTGLPGTGPQPDMTGPISDELKDGAQDQHLAAGQSSIEAHQRWPQTPAQTPSIEKSTDDAFSITTEKSLTTSLLPKLLQTTKILFSSETFFYSYDQDITRSLASDQSSSDVPLARRVDPEYFYNQHLSNTLITEGHHEYVLPIMQGFVGQRGFSLKSGPGTDQLPPLPEGSEPPQHAVLASVHSSDNDKANTSKSDLSEFLLTVISRRSTKRSGLRYLRRGIDEDGHVANAVETEQILSSPTPAIEQSTYSFLQTRGSIPLFFSQLPYSFKPPPKLLASDDTNLEAMRKHFASLSARYGQLQAVSLVDRHGPEVQIGEAYERTVAALNNAGGTSGKAIGFEWFEFHNACRDMKFENVSQLIETITPFIVASGYTTLQSTKRLTSQSGIVRTNCMDCLDRTNVVQSAMAQYVLEQQLANEGYSINLTTDPYTTWFNTLWADNGDAISRAYTGTSALKGDYTRTRKRNALGALNDLSLTLNRYYKNFFDDFFAQAAIDYLLGSVDETVFTEFEEHMTTADPAIDLSKARQVAINEATNVVIEEQEDLIHGWTVLAPTVPSDTSALPLVEMILLLTETALYVVRFDWDTRKVHSFQRVELETIMTIRRGSYFSETHTARQMDPNQNYGLSIFYEPPPAGAGSNAPLMRVNTRSLKSAISDAGSVTGADNHAEDEPPTNNSNKLTSRTIVFKALPRRSRSAKTRNSGPEETERATIHQISEELLRAAEKRKKQLHLNTEIVLEQRAIRSLAEAKRGTGYVESLAFSVKKAIWG